MTHQRLRTLLEHLDDGRFHSGEELGTALACSRAAIWGMVRHLREFNLDIHSVKGRGYRLATPIELLDADAITRVWQQAELPCQPTLEILQQTDSTNSYLLKRIKKGIVAPHLVLAEYQSMGRGRRGRSWVSPFGQNIYFSLYWKFNAGPAGLSGLSLVVALAIITGLESLGIEGLALKWPNDIYRDGKKLAGILIEVNAESDGPSDTVIGVGINFSMSASSAEAIDQPWTDLLQAKAGISRNHCVATVTAELSRILNSFAVSGFEPFLDAWRRYDIAFNQPIEVEQSGKRIAGVGRGVDNLGMLLLDDGQRIRHIASGEVSLRLR